MQSLSYQQSKQETSCALLHGSKTELAACLRICIETFFGIQIERREASISIMVTVNLEKQGGVHL